MTEATFAFAAEYQAMDFAHDARDAGFEVEDPERWDPGFAAIVLVPEDRDATLRVIVNRYEGRLVDDEPEPDRDDDYDAVAETLRWL